MRHFTTTFAIALLLLTACSSPGRPVSSPQPTTTPLPAHLTKASGIPCADLVAAAMASPDTLIAGSFACMDPTAVQQMAAFQPPITDDASLEAYAQVDPVFTQAAFFAVVRQNGQDIATYNLRNPDSGATLCMGVWLNGNAPKVGPDHRLVDGVGYNSQRGTC